MDNSALLAPTVKSGTYNGTQYAAPQTSDGGILYYRKDLVPTPPKTWDEMLKDCDIAKAKGIGCYAGQFAKYEGLTVNVAEAINTNGGTIVGDDGKTVTVDSAEANAGLTRLVDGFKNGQIPAEAITYQEEQGRAGVRGGQAAVPAQLAVRVQPGQDRRQLDGEGHLRHRTAARASTPASRASPAWVATTPRSASTPSTRRPRSSS